MLSRIQFGLTAMFHYLFPPLTIGMGVVLVFLEGRYLRTGDKRYHDAARFWTSIFALNFAIGVASGIVMEFQFGTNWANYSRFVGDVFGSASWLPRGFSHFFWKADSLPCWSSAGTKSARACTFSRPAWSRWGRSSAVSGSWLPTVGSKRRRDFTSCRCSTTASRGLLPGSRSCAAEITNFWQLVFNPSSVERLTHVLIGCFIMGGFFVMSISAWYVLKGKHLDFAKRSFRGGLLFATVFSIAALISGDLQAHNVYRTQPAKLATFEGHYQTGPGDLTILGIPHPDQQRVGMSVAIPGGLSILLFGDPSKPMIGTDQFAPSDRPPAVIPFFTWRIMVGLGCFFILITLLACLLLWRGSLFEQRWLMWVFVVSVLGAVAANQTGWISAEVGRQPWSVYPPTPWIGVPGESALPPRCQRPRNL